MNTLHLIFKTIYNESIDEAFRLLKEGLHEPVVAKHRADSARTD